MIRLLIADDHRLMREALKQLFTILPDIKLVGEAINGIQVLEYLHENAVDLLLLDMSMPGLCGDDLITRIRIQHPKLPILIFSMHNKSQFVSRALKAGANGYITKDDNPDTLIAAIRQVAAGGCFIDTKIAEQLR